MLSNEDVNGIFIKSFSGLGAIARLYSNNSLVKSTEEAKANGLIFVDAMNTVNKCNTLPSELLKQRDELLHALNEIKRLYGDRTDYIGEYEIAWELVSKTIESINNK